IRGRVREGIHMSRKFLLALAAGTLIGGTALAQSQPNPNTSPEDQMKARRAAAEASKAAAAQPGELQQLTGTVKSYKAGKKIVVTDAGGKNHSLKLDESARVESTLKPGDPVTVEWMVDADGKERVSSVSTASSTGSNPSGSAGTPPSSPASPS